jgi:hypothetical protein
MNNKQYSAMTGIPRQYQRQGSIVSQVELHAVDNQAEKQKRQKRYCNAKPASPPPLKSHKKAQLQQECKSTPKHGSKQNFIA